MSYLISALLAVAVVVGLSFAILALFPRKRRALIPATVTLLLAETGLTVLGSALVGPIDLRPMLFWVPVSASVVTVWYFWKIKPKEMANG